MTLQPYRNDLIKGAMAANDLNRERLSAITGLSLTTLSSIRGGEANVTLSNLIAVADALGLSMQDLFTPKPETETATA